MNMSAIMAKTDRLIQGLIEERKSELDDFICNDDGCYYAAKALVSAILSNHFALRAMENDSKPPSS